MIPEYSAVAHLVKLGYSYAVFVGLTVFCIEVHCDFAKIKVRSYACRGGYACCFKHVKHHFHRKLTRRQAIGFEIIRCVNENLVDRINVDILGSNIFQIDIIYPGADLHVMRHSRRCGDECQLGRRVFNKLGTKIRFMAEAMPGSLVFALGVDFAHLLNCLKKSRPAGDPIGFEGRGDGETDGFLRPRRVGDNKVCVQRVKTPVDTFDRSIERFKVYCNICLVRHRRHLRIWILDVDKLYKRYLMLISSKS